MQNMKKTVFHSKRHRGWLVRVIGANGSFFCNAFAPNGLLVSYSFASSLDALSFAQFFIKKLSQGWSC